MKTLIGGEKMDTLISRYAEYLKNGRKELVDAVQDVTHEELHYDADGALNSIAMILNHAAGAEKFLIHKLVAGDEIQRDRDTEFAPHGDTLQQILAKLEQSQARTMEILESMTDSQLLDEKKVRLSSGERTVTNEWGILHTLEHEAHHKGQVVQLKRLARAHKA